MVVFDNLAHILQNLLESATVVNNEWKVLGEDNIGRIYVGWSATENKNIDIIKTCIGRFNPNVEAVQVLLQIPGRHNIIQASTEDSLGLVSYVEKNQSDNRYKHFVSSISGQIISSLNIEGTSQIMTTFLISSKAPRLLVLIHNTSAMVYHLILENDLVKSERIETITKGLTWGQWNPVTQTLYFIHFRQVTVNDEEGERIERSATLSGFQFHAEVPHEAVMNIPLNLPSLKNNSTTAEVEGENKNLQYEDDCIPLRVHDCSLDLLIVSDSSGVVCICHHYLYQPVKPPTGSSSPGDDSMTVHFAYTVTLLHHGCVVHCTVPGIAWSKAKTLRPAFSLLGSQYLLINGPGVLTHLLDVGAMHEPNCHIILPTSLSDFPSSPARLVSLLGSFGELSGSPLCDFLNPVIMVDLITLDLHHMEVANSHLISAFEQIQSESNRQAILHYSVVHSLDHELLEELLGLLSMNPIEKNMTQFLEEILVGGAFSLTRKGFSTEGRGLLSLLPITLINRAGKCEVKVENTTIWLNQEILWNTAMMILSPQQRLVPYCTDIWTRLWEHLAGITETPRFNHTTVCDKLLVSLSSYQPEVLSRCTTPMSPITTSGFSPGFPLLDTSGSRRANELPFLEADNCTASKQEHVISVNVRELNMFLMRESRSVAPMQIHAVTAQYVAAQLEIARQLCQLLTKASLQDTPPRDKGFAFIRKLTEEERELLWILLKRYHHAAELLAFPVPQGFASFFCYLGFTVLSFPIFLQFIQNNVFQLQIDVMKEMLRDIDESHEGVMNKVRLIESLPRSRAQRLLTAWSHPLSLMIRAREHALKVLSGGQTSRPRGCPHIRRSAQSRRGIAAFPSKDRVSPLDTFLDLLTAKASLTELDFNLLIEATVASTEDILSFGSV